MKKATKTTIIALANHKGGTGKTTTAVNLAAALAGRGNTVLLVDLDGQANASQASGIQTETNTLYNVLKGECTALAAIRQTAGGYNLLPACLDLAAADLELTSVPDWQHLLADALEPVKGAYKYIILDCPPSLGLLALNGLAAADLAIIPARPEPFSITGIGRITDVIAKLQKRVNPRLQLAGVLFTGYDNRTVLHKDLAAELAERLPVLAVHIRPNIALAESTAAGQDVLTYAPDSNGATDYKALAELVETL